MKGPLALCVLLAVGVDADVYMHNPRGSNNRNCRNDNNENRRNGNRLFDSQNNNKGGYSCPRSYPFACYKYADGSDAKNTCQGQNTGNQANKAAVNNDPSSPMFGELTSNNQDVVRNERMFYYVGSTLPLEWTAQHGCGENPKVHCDMIIEIGCEDTLTDSMGTIRDGTPINNNDGDNLNDEATDTIPAPGPGGDITEQDDGRYGRHETLAYYRKCKNRERNKGLWIADQKVQNNQGATATRQNPNANRNGLECKEEVDYYPYWHPTPWKTLAILTSNVSRCETLVSESQNVKPKHECICAGANEEENQATTDNSCDGNSQLPNNEKDCLDKEGATWVERPAFGVPPPLCRAGAFSRDNHLGNAATAGSDPIMMNWTIPDWVLTNNVGLEQFGKEYARGASRCVLRLRYNLSSADHGDLPEGEGFNVPVVATSKLNAKDDNGVNPEGDGTPIFDRDNNEEKSYKAMLGFDGVDQKMGYATNTNQYGRVFQDRSYSFTVVSRDGTDVNGQRVATPTGDTIESVPSKCSDALQNFNVRGKRGNIVQAYPSVEYDFVPNKLTLTEDDCIHMQWTGTDYNPNRNPNNGEGGPPNPNNSNEGKSDRSNIVQMSLEANNFPVMDASKFTMFDATETQWKRMVFNNQPLDSATECLTVQGLKDANINNRQDRERDYRNCGKLSGQAIPHLNVGVVKAGAVGRYEYMSTRNNNLSNRGQKGELIVTESKNKGLSAGAMAGVVIGSLVVVGAAAGGFFMMKNRSGGGRGGGSYLPHTSRGQGAVPTETKALASAPSGTVLAKHEYKAQEAGELTFSKGDRIVVLRKDASGWWEGKCNGQTGVFPANYVA